jgi:hypothetical protein
LNSAQTQPGRRPGWRSPSCLAAAPPAQTARRSSSAALGGSAAGNRGSAHAPFLAAPGVPELEATAQMECIKEPQPPGRAAPVTALCATDPGRRPRQWHSQTHLCPAAAVQSTCQTRALANPGPPPPFRRPPAALASSLATGWILSTTGAGRSAQKGALRAGRRDRVQLRPVPLFLRRLRAQ